MCMCTLVAAHVRHEPPKASVFEQEQTHLLKSGVHIIFVHVRQSVDNVRAIHYNINNKIKDFESVEYINS